MKAWVLVMVLLLLLTGCNDEEIKVSDPLYISKNNDYTVPFKISEIKSVFVNLNDIALEKPLRGVRYEVSLLSEKEISNEDRTSFNFEILTDSSILKKSTGPIQPVHLTDTRNGYLYSLSFETIYGDYSKEELEELIKERNFQILLVYKGVNNVLEFL